MKPIIAVVGRPNVGKSTLFNRLVGSQVAIVHDAPGVTRDRNYADAILAGRSVTFVDTGGFDPTTDDPMGQGIARHVRAAIEEADVIVCVLDGSLPPTAPDRDAVSLLRRAEKPVLFVANKMDGQEKEWGLGEHYELGITDLLAVSALHGRHVGKLEAAIFALLPASPEEETLAYDAEEETSIVLLGRPNAGKSSLFNRLTGEERSLVDSRPGTTRDPVDSWFEFKGKKYRALDTAGIRRKSKVDEGVEAASVIRSLRAIDRAHVVVLMVDATSGLAEQDARLLGLCRERGRAVVVGLNKADLMNREDLKKAEEDAETALHFARYAHIIPMSAKSGTGVAKLMSAVDMAAAAARKRVTTSELNRFFEKVLVERPPPTRGGKAPRLYYITQTAVNPPTFIAFCSSPENVAESYRRFVTNRIRQEFGFDAAPLRVHFRGRGRDD
jgi:GTPase